MRHIPPGRAGTIQVTVNTNGYAGRKIREVVRIRTNDLRKRETQVVLTGLVEKFADVKPERIRMEGKTGTPMYAEIEIIPRPEYPFAIKGIRARSGEFIEYEVTQRCSEVEKKCVIRVENRRTERGVYADALFIDTDSELRPTIPILITGIVLP